jgi:hypothetical protein
MATPRARPTTALITATIRSLSSGYFHHRYAM